MKKTERSAYLERRRRSPISSQARRAKEPLRCMHPQSAPFVTELTTAEAYRTYAPGEVDKVEYPQATPDGFAAKSLR